MQPLLKRFLTASFLIILLPMVVISVIHSYFFNRNLLSVLISQEEAANREIVANIDDEISNHSVLTASLMYDQVIKNTSLKYWDEEGGITDKTLLARELADHLNTFFIFANRIGVIALEYHDGTILYFGNSPQVRDSLQRSDIINEPEGLKPARVDIFSLTSDSGGIHPRFILGGVIQTPDEYFNGSINRIFFCVRGQYIENLIRHTDNLGNAGLLIFDHDDELLFYTGNAADLPSYYMTPDVAGSPDRISQRRHMSFISSEVETTGWKIITVTDESSIFKTIAGFRWFSFGFIVMLLLLFSVYVLIFLRRLSAPLTQLFDSMRILSKLEKPEPINSGGVRELDLLFHRFNEMAHTIDRLTREREERERQRLELEISALQLQINPHFMANTLNIIRFMAMASKNRGIHDMIQSLIRIVSDSYAMKEPFTTLKSEIENIRHYIYIMNVRFNGNLNLDVRIDPDVENARVLRMMLQPIVENALIHGFSESPEADAVISIGADKVDERLLITIADRGCGMERDIADRILHQTYIPEGRDQRFNPVGLKNVHDRIRLTFGDEYGLRIRSKPDQGTEVDFFLPFIESVCP